MPIFGLPQADSSEDRSWKAMLKNTFLCIAESRDEFIDEPRSRSLPPRCSAAQEACPDEAEAETSELRADQLARLNRILFRPLPTPSSDGKSKTDPEVSTGDLLKLQDRLREALAERPSEQERGSLPHRPAGLGEGGPLMRYVMSNNSVSTMATESEADQISQSVSQSLAEADVMRPQTRIRPHGGSAGSMNSVVDHDDPRPRLPHVLSTGSMHSCTSGLGSMHRGLPHVSSTGSNLSSLGGDQEESPTAQSRSLGFRRIGSTNSMGSMASMASFKSALSSASGPRRGRSGMPHVGSTSSMASLISGFSEDQEVEFELNITDSFSSKPVELPAGSHAPCSASTDNESAEKGAAPQKQPAAEWGHANVPRNTNLVEEFEKSKDVAPITTLMIRNIPNHYSQRDLVRDLAEFGLGDAFDFLYVPVDKGTQACVGYAFVNFLTPELAQQCMTAFSTFRFKRRNRHSGKVAAVSVAHIQGLEKNLQHYKNTAVLQDRQRQRRPIVVNCDAHQTSGAVASAAPAVASVGVQ